MCQAGRSNVSDDAFDNLDAGGRATAALARRPKAAVFTALVLLAAAAWFVLFAMAVDLAALAPGDVGPGGAILSLLPAVDLPDAARWFIALCLQPAGPGTGLAAFLALCAMWFLMALAMMLPSAAPLVRTYCEIADTAAAKGEPAAHPLVLVAGYLAVWLAASAGFSLVTLLVAAGPGAQLSPAGGIVGAAALAIAGAWQFSGLKDACLEKCRNPFGILFARWSARPIAIFRLGMEQGVWCLGCCWALMLVMFAVGIMNVFWMALLAVLAIVEKQGRSPWVTRGAGAILLVWATALLVVSV
jgi:predicted metal-binding membrane protein